MSWSVKYILSSFVSLFLFLGVTAVNAGGDKISCLATGSSDIKMDARYEVRDDGRTKFDASYEAGLNSGHFEGEELSVFVAGQNVGSIVLTLVPFGFGGDLEFDSDVEGPLDDSVAFPANFPAVSENTSVTIGTLGCSLD